MKKLFVLYFYIAGAGIFFLATASVIFKPETKRINGDNIALCSSHFTALGDGDMTSNSINNIHSEPFELSVPVKKYLDNEYPNTVRIGISFSELPVCIVQDLTNKKSNKLEVEKILDKTLVQGWVIKSDCLFLVYKNVINDNDCKPIFCDGCIESPCRKIK